MYPLCTHRMSSMDDMAAAHRRDYADLNAMRVLQGTLRAFTEQSPSRCHQETVLMLQKALRSLEADMAHIVRVWD